jgi:hypothetical protein
MNNDAASFIGDIPEHYDSGLGPMIFVDYAAEHRAPSGRLQSCARTGKKFQALRALRVGWSTATR